MKTGVHLKFMAIIGKTYPIIVWNNMVEPTFWNNLIKKIKKRPWHCVWIC